MSRVHPVYDCHTVTITRTVEVEVTLGHRPRVSPTWWQPGEPEEWWIESAWDHSGNPIELEPAEAEEAVTKASNQADEDLNPIDSYPEDDNHKPF